MNSEKAYIAHQSAYIDQPCLIGRGTRIWHFSHIMKDCVIGEQCTIGQNVLISPSCEIGNNVKIQNNVSIYTGVILEDDVFCGPSAVFTNVVNPRSHVPRKNEYKRTLVMQGASIGANATVVCGVTLGAYCFVGAGAVVTRDVPSYALAYGNPARIRGWVCNCGLKLELGLSKGYNEVTQCVSCGRQYIKDGLAISEFKCVKGLAYTPFN